MNIGVFDSGSGGLTIMRALDEAFPDRSLIYLGDHANAPYGNRSPDEIYALTLRNLERLFGEDCALVVIACNTAVARGLRRLQREWLPFSYPNHRVLGVIVPVVEDVTGMQWNADQLPVARLGHAPDLNVAVFATHHTAESGVFAGEIHKRSPHIEVWQQACARLVPLIEEDAPELVLKECVEGYVSLLKSRMSGKEPDVCILGCTHYPLIEPLFREILPQGTRILSQPSVTARSLVAYLDRHREFPASGICSRTFLTTGKPALASRIASRFYGRAVTFISAENIRSEEWSAAGA
ncbi:glutamate racemase [Rhizobium sp. PP-F2F-G48]|uniref:glutamate racemase n=1 Tax=Rhizobium sp. PP-F2F-G48 TaxID=2135651 RepID=UPI001045D036|nr:glutamate racemase [Rhizobium sp. PP-F2F-G48]TCM51042.1 glutamate racemase [Rhizobium sp. PP-F2F-G48]